MDLNDYVFVGLERSFLKALSPHLQKENDISYEFTFCEDDVSSRVWRASQCCYMHAKFYQCFSCNSKHRRLYFVPLKIGLSWRHTEIHPSLSSEQWDLKVCTTTLNLRRRFYLLGVFRGDKSLIVFQNEMFRGRNLCFIIPTIIMRTHMSFTYK